MCSLQILNPSTKQKLQMWSLKKAFIDLLIFRAPAAVSFNPF